MSRASVQAPCLQKSQDDQFWRQRVLQVLTTVARQEVLRCKTLEFGVWWREPIVAGILRGYTGYPRMSWLMTLELRCSIWRETKVGTWEGVWPEIVWCLQTCNSQTTALQIILSNAGPCRNSLKAGALHSMVSFAASLDRFGGMCASPLHL